MSDKQRTAPGATRPLLALVVPCHNSSERIAALVPGLKALSDPRIEIIFIDDRSSDDTRPRLEALQKELKVPTRVLAGEFFGPGNARNAGLRSTTALYVWFVDSDDRIFPDAVQRRLDEIERDTPDVVRFRMISDGHIQPTDWLADAPLYQRFMAYGGFFERLFNTEFLRSNSIAFADALACEDNHLLLQAAHYQRTELAFDDVIYEMVLTEDSICRGPFNPSYLTRWRAVREMLEFIRSHAPDQEPPFRRHLVFLSIGLTWSYFLERGRAAALLPLMPRLIASLRSLGLGSEVSSFLRTGSLANRAFKYAAYALSWPVSFFCRDTLDEPGRRPAAEAAAQAQPSSRKLAGIALIMLLIVFWAAFVASLAPVVGRWPILVQAPYYLVMGIAWIIPLKPLVRWVESGRWRAPPE